MFSSKKQPAIRSLIGEGTGLEGTLRFRDGLRIDGEVRGDVVAEPGSKTLLVISEKARVVGRVQAAHVIINGRVEGPVESSQLLELQPKAVILGDVRYAALEMHQGATIEGVMQRLQPAAAGEEKVLKLALAAKD
jgi:cytoskeletal protein CcmA (bactofilin family)